MQFDDQQGRRRRRRRPARRRRPRGLRRGPHGRRRGRRRRPASSTVLVVACSAAAAAARAGRCWTRCIGGAGRLGGSRRGRPATARAALQQRRGASTSTTDCSAHQGLQRGEHGLERRVRRARRCRTGRRGSCSSTGGRRPGLRAGELPRAGPFYCPPDQRIYFDLGFLDAAAAPVRRAGPVRAGVHRRPRGRPPPADLLGHRAEGAGSSSSATPAGERALGARWSCRPTATPASGAPWPTSAGTADHDGGHRRGAERGGGRRRRPDPGELRGRVDPESFTHGSAAQRKQWFPPGSSSGDLDRCNTFGG